MLGFVMDVLFATVSQEGAQYPGSKRSSKPRKTLRFASVVVAAAFACVVVWELLRWVSFSDG